MLTEFPTGFGTAISRWSGIGPYYAMFPQRFAFEKIQQYTRPKDRVLDPFAGRGTSIFYAAAQGRSGYGVEMNPVGWLYGHVKLNVADGVAVENRLIELCGLTDNYTEGDKLPKFFQHCYSTGVLSFLLAARAELDWRSNIVDATLMAIILVDLHGNRGQSLSNQMRQTKSMAPAYSIDWWEKQKMVPPEIDVLSLLTKKIRWRFAKGIPQIHESKIAFGNSLVKLPEEVAEVQAGKNKKFKLLLTSPPYHNVTNYEYDQWLRYWMLGGPNFPVSAKTELTSRYVHKPEYINLLEKVFTASSEMMQKSGIVYVRTDAREFTRDTTLEILQKCFPKKKLSYTHSIKAGTQTSLFGDKTLKPGEIDIILC